MKQFGLSITFLFAVFSVAAFADDQQKAQKQLHKITAMTTDATGRRIVSMTVVDALAAKLFLIANLARCDPEYAP